MTGTYDPLSPCPKGRYLLLMGNDDGLHDANVLEEMHGELIRHQPVAVAITNYREFSSGRLYRRMRTTGVLGSGTGVAVSTFRRYSFVSGVILEGEGARTETTDSCDGSEMYQMYLGSRLVARGGRFLSIDRTLIDKDIQIPGQTVDSYRLRPRLRPCPIVERTLPMGRLLEVVARGLEPCHHGRQRELNLLHVCRQLYGFIYPYWIVEYRRVQSWRYALGVSIGFRPSKIARGQGLSRKGMLQLWAMYLLTGGVALAVPIGLFDFLQPRLYALAKRLRPA